MSELGGDFAEWEGEADGETNTDLIPWVTERVVLTVPPPPES